MDTKTDLDRYVVVKCGKHLVTLEPGITENQTDEMKAKYLQLVVPAAIHETYKPSQRDWLMCVADFVELVKARQN
jgi:hypothetical protein